MYGAAGNGRVARVSGSWSGRIKKGSAEPQSFVNLKSNTMKKITAQRYRFLMERTRIFLNLYAAFKSIYNLVFLFAC